MQKTTLVGKAVKMCQRTHFIQQLQVASSSKTIVQIKIKYHQWQPSFDQPL